MYGTIAKLKTKDGAVDEIRMLETMRRPVGYMGTFVFQSDEDPHEVWMVAIFDSRESYGENARSPEQDEEFRELRKNLTEEPEWHDGEIVFATEMLPQPC
jgi:heme-degrading monooxygenase HmoA